jgi:nitric oxide synthase oxygenase domain/subunit
MTAKQFNDALRRLRLSVYASADVLDISLRQAQRYASGEQTVSGPVANHLTQLVQMVDGWRSERKKVLQQIDFFSKPDTSISVNGKDDTKSWVAQLHVYLAEWDSLLATGANGQIPPQSP